MVDAKQPIVSKYQAPSELPGAAQTQKTLGKRKRSPDDQAEYFYNIRHMHILFFFASAALVVALVLMFWDDYKGVTRQANRDWKDVQRTFAALDFAKLEYEMAQAEKGLAAESGKLSSLERKIEKVQKELDDADARRPIEITIVEAKLPALEKEAGEAGWGTPEPQPQGDSEKLRRELRVRLPSVNLVHVEERRRALEADHYRKQMDVNFRNSDKMAIRFRYETAEQHAREARGTLREGEANTHFSDMKKEWIAILSEVEKAKREFEAVDWKVSLYDRMILALRKEHTELVAERNRLRKDVEDKRRRYRSEKPQPANTIRNAPVLDFFDPTIKIQQVILDDIPEDYHFAKVGRVERCHTCHKGIDNPAYEVEINRGAQEEVDQYRFKDSFLRATVEHALGRSKDCEICASSANPQIAHGSWSSDDAVKTTKALMAHPRLDLYASNTSPHALGKVGCTICHEGDGRETEFSRAVHVPVNEAQKKAWERRHGYRYRELWDRPMLPRNHVYASCRRCHREDVELPYADDYTKGMLLYERAGCYACHRTDMYQVLPKDVNNPHMDPNRKARRPGPPLTHIADKVSPDWAFLWIQNPKQFRLTTRMPSFFGQSNARTIRVGETTYGPQKVEEAVVSTMVDYLFGVSQTRDYPAPPSLKGDARRGEAIFEQIGCRACHAVAEPSPRTLGQNPDDVYRAPDGESWYLKEFGPNLGAVGTKLGSATAYESRGRTWLYHWIKDPEHYFPQTRMPKMRPPDKPEMDDQEVTDLVEYLMSRQKAGWPVKAPKPEVDEGLIDTLIYEQLRFKMPEVDAQEELAEMKKDPQAKRRWLGRKMVQNYGCYSCHELKPDAREDVARLKSRIENEIDWTNLEGIGVEMTGAQPEGVKAVDRLDFGYTHVDELGNHQGVTFRHGYTGETYKQVDQSALAEREPERVQVLHSRHDWIRNKLLDPRVFDGGKLGSKPPDELLRMPNFYFNAEEARLLTTFVLSFTDHDIPSGLVERVKKRLAEDGVALNRGERLVRESNCRACHRFQLDRFLVEYEREERRGGKTKEVTTDEWVEGRLKNEYKGSQAAEILAQWGLKVYGDPWIRNFDWTADGRTLEVPAVVTKTNGYIAFDGRDLWYVEGSEIAAAAVRRVKVHRPQEGGDIIAQIREFKSAHAAEFNIDLKNEGEFENRIPPMLRTQGSKTQAEWLYEFLRRPAPVRPALLLGRAVPPEHKEVAEAADAAFQAVDLEEAKELFAALEKAARDMPAGPARDRVVALCEAHRGETHGSDDEAVAAMEELSRAVMDAIKVSEFNIRMPTFGFSDEEAASLAKYFWVRDQVPGRDPYPYTYMPERESGYVSRRMPLLEKTRKTDVAEVCLKCHFLEGKPPTDQSVTKVGPELMRVAARLRPRWLYAWMRDPLLVYPGTTMVRHQFESEDMMRANVEWMLNVEKTAD
ncbi:MAG: c-type cytochrome [Planctomycetes bacterium]|nr:c-type cytochrome [Planctomycetota bacterium]